MKSKRIISLAVFSAIAVISMTGCSDTIETPESSIESSSSEISVEAGEPETEELTTTEPETEPENTEKFTKDFFGDDTVGYVVLKDAGEWLDFQEIDQSADVFMKQVSRKDMSAVITLAAFESELTTEDFAQNVAGTMELQGAQGITGATVELGVDKITSFQVYGYYPADDIFMVTWVFEVPENNYLHYVTAEFSGDDNIVPLMDTFSMKQPE